MGITLRSRESYHPTVTNDGRFTGGERDYHGRLSVIEREVDFTGKKVLDLGCSGGFYSFKIGEKAKSVVGLDGDRDLIEKNRRLSVELGRSNIEFICGNITPKLLLSLGRFDIVIFLSVFHHMLTDSATYDWNDVTDDEGLSEILRAISEIADVYVFEMGRPDESFHWSPAIKAKIGEPREWVPQHVFRSEFEVNILKGAAYQKFPLRFIPQLGRVGFNSRVGRKLYRIAGIDQRDLREIYVGRRREALCD